MPFNRSSNKNQIRALQQRNPNNYANELFKTLTRLFSGPLVQYRRQTEKTLRGKQLNKYKSKFKSTSGQSFQRSAMNPFEYLQYHLFTNQQRAQRYMDFSAMEFDPDIASVLDVYAGEITAHSHLEKMLRIKCGNEEIKEVLKVLYYDILNVNHNLFGWTRTLVKYGDLFLYLDIDESKGVQSVIGLPTEEIERLEGLDPTNPNYHQFQWNAGSMTFENWQIAHFRLLGNDKYAPYGTAVLDAARRIFKQLTLLEQAMMSYRVTRSAERRVFYVDVGNISPEEVEQYMQKLMTNMKRSLVINDTTGQVDERYNPLCFSGDTRIRTLDGRNDTIKEIVEKWNAGQRDIEVYSIDHENGGGYVPGKIIWAGKSGQVDRLIEITLDDGGKIRVTPDHKMMLRDGNPIRAKDLKPGISLMPFYTRKQKINYHKKYNKEYEQIYDPSRDDYVFTHRMVAASSNNLLLKENGGVEGSCVVHHRDFNRFNNSSSNLEMMSAKDHFVLHSSNSAQTIERNKRLGLAKHMGEMYNGTELHKQHNAVRSLGMKNMWSDSRRRKKAQSAMALKFDDVCMFYLIEIIKNSEKYIPISVLGELIAEDAKFVDYFNSINTRSLKASAFHRHMLLSFLRKAGYKNYRAFVACHNPNALNYYFQNNYFKATNGKNHKVVMIEEISGNFDVYNVTVDRYFNLAIQAGNVSSDSECGKVQSFQSVEEDFFLPVRGQGTGTKIESLPGGSYTGDIDDVKYLRDKLFSALKVPQSYVSRGESGSEDKESLSQKDLIFARTVQRIQRPIVSELEKIGIIHLYINGFRGEDLLSFTLSLNNPSKISEMQDLDLWKTKFDVAASATEGFFSRRWISEKLFNQSDEEFRRNQRELFYDRTMDAEYEKIVSAGEMDAGGGMGGDLGGEDMGEEGGLEPEDTSSGTEESPEPAAEEEEGVLLAKPGDEGALEEELGVERKGYLTPGAKGKEYHPVTVDKRDQGAQLRHMQGLGSGEKGSNTERNVFKGKSELSTSLRRLTESLKKEEENTIYSDKEDEKLLEENMKQIVEIQRKLAGRTAMKKRE